MTSPGQHPAQGGQWGAPPPQPQPQRWAPQQPQPQPQRWAPQHPPQQPPPQQPQPHPPQQGQWAPPPHAHRQPAPPAWQHPPQQPWPGPAHGQGPGHDPEDPRPSPAVLLATTAWRLGIGSLALYYAQTGKEETMSSESLSYLSNVGTGVGFLALAAYPLLVGGRRHEPRTAWLRGALTILMLLVGLVFVVGMGGEPDGPHAVIPALVTVDWLFVGRSQFRTRAWEPITWLALPLLYLGYHQANDVPLYDDILGDEAIGTAVPALLAGTVVLGYVLWGAVLVRRAVSRGTG